MSGAVNTNNMENTKTRVPIYNRMNMSKFRQATINRNTKG